jgi:predicted dinucleotide-binding enzyme
MRIGVIGAGRIGGNCARQAAKGGHDVMLSFSRARSSLEQLASEIASETAAAFNARRMPGARYTKSFNTLTSGFQAQAASRRAEERVVQWICGDDQAAKEQVAKLIEDMGYVPPIPAY